MITYSKYMANTDYNLDKPGTTRIRRRMKAEGVEAICSLLTGT